jgi:hypothetical protein
MRDQVRRRLLTYRACSTAPPQAEPPPRRERQAASFPPPRPRSARPRRAVDAGRARGDTERRARVVERTYVQSKRYLLPMRPCGCAIPGYMDGLKARKRMSTVSDGSAGPERSGDHHDFSDLYIGCSGLTRLARVDLNAIRTLRCK